MELRHLRYFIAVAEEGHITRAAERLDTLNLVVGLGVSFVPASLQRMHMNGVAYRRLKGAVKLTAPLNLASRRGDPSVVVGHFRNPVRKAAKNFADD